MRANSTSVMNMIYDNIRPESLTSSPLVDLELHPIISYLMRDYVGNWFSDISADEELILELVRTFTLAIRHAEQRLAKVDWIPLLTKDVPEALRVHLADSKRARNKMGSMYAGNASIEELFHGLQPHLALDSLENEHEYMRKVSEILLDVLFPIRELESEVMRYLLREVISETVLMLIVDKLSEPDMIHELIISVRVGERVSKLTL